LLLIIGNIRQDFGVASNDTMSISNFVKAGRLV
jgi:hypothetical protein